MLLNLRYNETIASFANAAGVGSGEQLRASATKVKPGGGACTCIAFRTGQPHRPALPQSPSSPPRPPPIHPSAYIQPPLHFTHICTHLLPPSIHLFVHNDTFAVGSSAVQAECMQGMMVCMMLKAALLCCRGKRTPHGSRGWGRGHHSLES